MTRATPPPANEGIKIARCFFIVGGEWLIGMSFFLKIGGVRIEGILGKKHTYESFVGNICFGKVESRFLLKAELKKYFPIAQPIFLRAVQQAWSHFWLSA